VRLVLSFIKTFPFKYLPDGQSYGCRMSMQTSANLLVIKT
jgi:hypothetical protein